MAPDLDRDLASIQEARRLLETASRAHARWALSPQEDTDRVCDAMARAAASSAEHLARLARDETGMGRYEDKVLKNRFAAEDVWRAYRALRTRGLLRVFPEARVKELAIPMGIVAALTPSTNPTSTAIYKALIAVKAGNAIVFSPHPRATECVVETVRILSEAARAAGAPPGLIGCMRTVTLEGTNELMRHRLTDVILATGGSALVRAAYSAGKPAFGVGPGNVPAIIERTADADKAVADIVTGKSFDNGLLCSAENSVICDAPLEHTVLDLFPRYGAHVCDDAQKQRLERTLAPGGRLDTSLAGQDAPLIARRAGFEVPPDTRVLVVRLERVGRDAEPLSIEKLSPVLGFYAEDGWRACCERAIQILELGGLGHSLAIHSLDERVIDAFFREKPAFRILVNTVAAMGATGYTTGLAPAMTLGPGAPGGSITSDNVGPLHLINIKRLAYEVRSMTRQHPAPAPGLGAAEDVLDSTAAQHAADSATAALAAPQPDLPGARCAVPQVAGPAAASASAAEAAPAATEPPAADAAPSATPARDLTPSDVERIVADFLRQHRGGR